MTLTWTIIKQAGKAIGWAAAIGGLQEASDIVTSVHAGWSAAAAAVIAYLVQEAQRREAAVDG